MLKAAEEGNDLKDFVLVSEIDATGDSVGAKVHERSNSSYSNNYSLLKMYEMESPQMMNHGQVGDQLDGILTEEIVDNGDIDGEEPGEGRRDGTTTSIPTITPENDRLETLVMAIDGGFEQNLKSLFDRYGFKKVSMHQKISQESYNEWYFKYLKYSVKQKKRWQVLMKQNGLALEADSSIPHRFPPKSDKVKKLIRKGIPAEWRGNAWFFYAGGHEKLNKNVGVYEKIVRDTKHITNKDTEVIERDLNRTFPDNKFFNEHVLRPVNCEEVEEKSPETPLVLSLRRLLIAFAHFQPQIGYCQSLNFLAGLLLLFMNEERAFWLLVILTERIIPKVHSANLEGVHTDQGVLMLCIKEYIPPLWSILGKNFDGQRLSDDKILTRLPPITLVTSSWFMSVFVNILPTETTLRVWDIMWYEGSKTIFRISLTICKMCLDHPDFQTSRHTGTTSPSEVEQIELFQFMQNFPKTILDPNQLIDNCFKKIGGYGFGSLSQDEINKCRDFISKQNSKIRHRKKLLTADLSQEERETLISSGTLIDFDDDNIHDIYGIHKPIMSGAIWNKNISNKVKQKFSRKSR